ncbi:RNA polymerase sigma factor [Streptomyces sp. NPDC093094]|uniref:RNA polymerase sigma factor n=1 Tax=Streptomyces sp. NPDC093094 TaxID=3366026 RepID=UPI00380917C9
MTSAGQGEGRADPRAAFYRMHHRRLVGYFGRRVSDLGEAEALAQETWMAFLRRFDSYQKMYQDPVAPLFVIARRKLVDWYRDKGKSPELPGDEVLGERLAQAAAACPDVISQTDLRIDLHRTIARLTPRQREAVELRYVDGLDRETVAALMGITVDGVKKLISAAVTTLRTAKDLAGYPPPTASDAGTTCKEVRK